MIIKTLAGANVAAINLPKSLGGGGPYAIDDSTDPNVQVINKGNASTHVIVTAKIKSGGAACTLRLIRYQGSPGNAFAVAIGSSFIADPATDSGRIQKIIQQSDLPGLYGIWLVSGSAADLEYLYLEFGRSAS